jgi:hypothetical protein
MICHCSDCQTLSGSAFRTVVLTHEDAFKLLTGELKIYVKTGESGTKRPQAFCPECGTPILQALWAKGLRSTRSVSARLANATSLSRSCNFGVARHRTGCMIWVPSRRSRSSQFLIDAAPLPRALSPMPTR